MEYLEVAFLMVIVVDFLFLLRLIEHEVRGFLDCASHHYSLLVVSY